MLLKLDDFQYDMSLDLNMVYYYIQLTEELRNLYMTIIPGGNTFTNIYQQERVTHRTFSNRK